MGTIRHNVLPEHISDKDKLRLKTISQSWTFIGYGSYVIEHSESNKKSCPLCSYGDTK